MWIYESSVAARHIDVTDERGRKASNIRMFNTHTGEAEIYAIVRYDEGEPKSDVVRARCFLYGHKAYYRKTGEVIDTPEKLKAIEDAIRAGK